MREPSQVPNVLRPKKGVAIRSHVPAMGSAVFAAVSVFRLILGADKVSNVSVADSAVRPMATLVKSVRQRLTAVGTPMVVVITVSVDIK